MQTKKLKINGITCSGAAKTVGSALNELKGVQQVYVSIASGEATVRYDEQIISDEQLKLEVQLAGYSIDNSDNSYTPRGKGSF